jgi:anthranilate/para-aminobenzoate synthase component II
MKIQSHQHGTSVVKRNPMSLFDGLGQYTEPVRFHSTRVETQDILSTDRFAMNARENPDMTAIIFTTIPFAAELTFYANNGPSPPYQSRQSRQ